MAALIAGERDPKVLAQLARSRMRTKIGRLEEAFNGHFDEHHRFLLQRMLDASTASTPTSPPSTNRSRRIWPLSRQRRRAWMRSPVSAGRRRGDHRRDRGGHVPVPHRGHLSRRRLARHQLLSRQDQGNGSTGTATVPGRILARRPQAPQERQLPRRTVPTHRPTARQQTRGRGSRRSILVIVWHLLADEDTRSPISVPITSPSTSTRMRTNATTYASSKRSDTPSPSPQRPDLQHSLGPAIATRPCRRGTPSQLTIISISRDAERAPQVGSYSRSTGEPLWSLGIGM